MLRYKQFSGSGVGLEQAINAWLARYEPEVTQMVQTLTADGAVTISFLFEESFRAQELRMAEEAATPAPADDIVSPPDVHDKPLEVLQESVPPAGGPERS